MSEAFIGEIRLVPFNFEPRGWTFCNGQLLSTTTYASLYSILGTAYGGNGINTFALPDLRERVPLQCGAGTGLTAYTLGEADGQAGVALTADQAAHTHTLMAAPNAANQANPTTMALSQANSSLGNIYHSPTNLVAMNANSLVSRGSNQAHENRSPFLALNFIICTSGIYPSHQ